MWAKLPQKKCSAWYAHEDGHWYQLCYFTFSRESQCFQHEIKYLNVFWATETGWNRETRLEAKNTLERHSANCASLLHTHRHKELTQESTLFFFFFCLPCFKEILLPLLDDLTAFIKLIYYCLNYSTSHVNFRRTWYQIQVPVVKTKQQSPHRSSQW